MLTVLFTIHEWSDIESVRGVCACTFRLTQSTLLTLLPKSCNLTVSHRIIIYFWCNPLFFLMKDKFFDEPACWWALPRHFWYWKWRIYDTSIHLIYIYRYTIRNKNAQNNSFTLLFTTKKKPFVGYFYDVTYLKLIEIHWSAS